MKRELKILRRPASTCILDDGSLLAVLSSDMQVDLYDLNQSPPRRKQCLILDNPPRAIALSPCGSVLAAAYESGIEVSSVSPGALPSDRRSVKCDGVDSLAFSFDGTQLLGTTTNSQQPNTVILTAPYYDPGAQTPGDNISAMWTTSILFPNSSRDCSHAVLLQESSSVEAAWTFTYDRSFETFRAVRIDDLRNGTTYFTGPIPAANSPVPLLPCTLPAASYCGDLVSAGFEGRDVWLYGIPEDLEAVPENSVAISDVPTQNHGLHRRNSGLSVRSPSRPHDSDHGRVPQWQLLCDKYRNTFISGHKIAALDNVNTVKWVSGFGAHSSQERLIIAARGVMPGKPITEEDGIDFIDGGRITILDFDYGVQDGSHEDITIDVGTREPEILEEESRDLDAEVAIVRRRTVARSRRGGPMRSATTATHQVDHLLVAPPPVPNLPASEDPLVPRLMPTARNASQLQHEEVEDVSLEEAQEALDAPYVHASPRSGPILRRAATAAAVNRRRNPEMPVAGRVEYRRADGRAEHPHESDADNWVPPPPPYTKEVDPNDLPSFLKHTTIPGVSVGQPFGRPPSQSGQTALPTPTSSRPELPRLQTSSPRGLQNRTSWSSYRPHLRMTSDSVSITRPATSGLEAGRPVSSLSTHRGSSSGRQEDEEDIYDATPPSSPRFAARPHCAGQSSERPSPQQAYTGGVSSATDYTPASSGSYRTVDEPIQGSAHANGSAQSLSSLDGTILRRNDEQAGMNPSIRRLSNAQTWPRAPPPQGFEALPFLSPMDGFPRSAPVRDMNNDELMAASFPPPPRPDQLASLHNRQDSNTPRRASGIFQSPLRRPGQDRASFRHSVAVPGLGPVPRTPEPDQPLIISTPRGVSGAFDSPGQPGSHGSGYGYGYSYGYGYGNNYGNGNNDNRTAPVLHAPVPVHPRPSTAASAILRPPVDRLEAIYGGGAAIAPPNALPPPPPHPGTAPPPPPPTPPETTTSQLTVSALRHHTSLSRRQSRARRSAAKNILDAKMRGWTGRSKRNAKANPNPNPNGDGTRRRGEDEAGWTDVTWPAGGGAPTSGGGGGPRREKKCAVM